MNLPFLILLLNFGHVLDSAIDFDDQARLGDREINDVILDGVLTPDWKPKRTKLPKRRPGPGFWHV